jgi:hypothetical protein
MAGYLETYLAVLRAEQKTLLENYYKPNEEGTGHFNTAAFVLGLRIAELEMELSSLPQ